MDIGFTICLELTYEHAHKTYITCVDYCLSNGTISLLSVVGDLQFVMIVEKARKQVGFPFCCVLIGIRDLVLRDDNFNILGRWIASSTRPSVYIC